MASRHLKRCEAHGLTYDPTMHSGCTLCRNSMAPKPGLGDMRIEGRDVAMVMLMALWVIAVVGGGYLGVQRLRARATEAAAKREAPAPMPASPASARVGVELPPPRSPAELPMLRRAGRDSFGSPRDAVDKVGLLSLLHAGEYAALTRHIEALQGEFEADLHNEDWMTQVASAFQSADPRVGERIEAWLRATPTSFAPMLARAAHRIALAWYYRGGDFAYKTERDRRDKFHEVLKTAAPDLERAISLHPKLVAAYQLKIWMQTGLGDHSQRKTFDAAAAICPPCFRIRSRYEVAISPRWGGSLEKMESFAAEAQQHVSENPRLKVLLGYADDERCRAYRDESNLAAALDACNHAVAAGDFERYYAMQSDVLEKLERPAEALAAIDRALDVDPQEYDALVDRGRLRLKLGHSEEGAADLRTAAWLDPVSSKLRSAVDYGVKALVYGGYKRSQAGDDRGAVAAYDLALSLVPGNEEALKYKVIADGRLLGADTVGQLEAASRADPTNFDTFKRIDDELVKTREFGRIVEHWNRFLAARPDDARGYLERGGAYVHLGQTEQALADLQRACTAGLQSGCQGVQFVRARMQAAAH